MLLLLAASCKEDPIGQQPVDGRRPNPIIPGSIQSIPRPGGAYIFYKLPNNDMDISYVKGEYEVNGEKRIVRSSVYKNYLVIDGLETGVFVGVNLYVVDHSENASEPEYTEFMTLEAPYTTMGNSIQMTPGVGGIGVRWKSQNEDVQYYANMGYLSSNYDSDIGIVLLAADSTGKMKELAVSFSVKCAYFQPVLDTSSKLYGAFAMDKWGHYSDTVFKEMAPLDEQHLNRRVMKEYYIGDDVREVDGWETHPLGYWGIIAKLFDSTAYCLQPTDNIASANYFATAGTNSVTNEPYLMPIHFTMDLGVTADVSRFWVAPKTHSRLDRFWEYSLAALYDFQLWGTTTDFGENSPDYIPANSTYWTEGEWMRDPRWKNMGRYLNKRHNATNDTPGNMTTEPPNNPGAAANWLDRDLAWTESRRIREMGNGYRYLADGSGPVKNNNFYFPDAGWHFAITEVGVGPVRYVRWQIHETWGQNNWVQFQELWYWGGVISENNQ
jgi:hypothetical protein